MLLVLDHRASQDAALRQVGDEVWDRSAGRAGPEDEGVVQW